MVNGLCGPRAAVIQPAVLAASANSRSKRHVVGGDGD